jgi:hypothetical protein
MRAGISLFARPGTEARLERLRADLASGAWHARHGQLLADDTLDVGYRLVVPNSPTRFCDSPRLTPPVHPPRSRVARPWPC